MGILPLLKELGQLGHTFERLLISTIRLIFCTLFQGPIIFSLFRKVLQCTPILPVLKILGLMGHYFRKNFSWNFAIREFLDSLEFRKEETFYVFILGLSQLMGLPLRKVPLSGLWDRNSVWGKLFGQTPGIVLAKGFPIRRNPSKFGGRKTGLGTGSPWGIRTINSHFWKNY